jgi:hypothetical protein
MRQMIRLMCILILTQGVFSQTIGGNLYQDWQNGKISESEMTVYTVFKTFRPDRLPEVYQVDAEFPMKCATGLMKQIRQNWAKLDADHKEVLQPYLFRPSLTFSVVSPSGRFRIHYEISGEDSVSVEDLDLSGIPDYVEETAYAVDTVFVVEVDTLEFPAPPPDQNHDGPEYDVYLINLSGVYGYTAGDTRLSLNPEIWTSYMVFDNDYYGFPTPPLESLRVTAAHEFHHMIQFGMQNRYQDIFMMEMTSTWMEDVVYDDVNDYYYYLNTYFRNTNIPFDDNNLYSSRMYGQCIWFHFLEARVGHRRFGKRLWEEIVNRPAMEAVEVALQEFGLSFDNELALFYGWNYMTGSRANIIQYYPEGDYYPEISLDGIFDFQSDMDITDEILPTASRYFRFDENDTTRYALIPIHVNSLIQSSSEEFTLEMAFNSTDPLFTELTNGVYANLIVDPVEDWRCVGVAELSGDFTFVLFNANSGVEKINREEGQIPGEFNLLQNHPNPFNPVTNIQFSIPVTIDAKLMIYNILGKEIETLIDEKLVPGSYHVKWNGSHLSSGIYFYRLEAGTFQKTRKFVLQK